MSKQFSWVNCYGMNSWPRTYVLLSRALLPRKLDLRPITLCTISYSAYYVLDVVVAKGMAIIATNDAVYSRHRYLSRCSPYANRAFL